MWASSRVCQLQKSEQIFGNLLTEATEIYRLVLVLVRALDGLPVQRLSLQQTVLLHFRVQHVCCDLRERLRNNASVDFALELTGILRDVLVSKLVCRPADPGGLVAAFVAEDWLIAVDVVSVAERALLWLFLVTVVD